ncbi:DUF4846 domain-containing protein, partial [bacterium]|nr:DUF4846 domain-containing protein [bacterium]
MAVRPGVGQVYNWLEDTIQGENLARRISAPEGFMRVPVESGSFADWLRNLPVKEADTAVYLYNDQIKQNQAAHVAVLDI